MQTIARAPKQVLGSHAVRNFAKRHTGNGIYTPTKEKVFRLQNGYYLLYYNNTKKWFVPRLFLGKALTLLITAYLIKINPFYRSYPIMLPLMVVFFFITVFRTMRYSRKTNNMIRQILLDQTGSELTFVYQNQMQRRLRADPTEATYMIQSMQNPPQADKYKALEGDLFPEEFPFEEPILSQDRHFYTKYFVSQNNFFCIPKQMTYINYEILCNAMSTNVIDFSQADIYELQNQEMTEGELEEFLAAHNEYTTVNWTHRYYQINLLHQTLARVSKIGKSNPQLMKNIRKVQSRTLEEIQAESAERQRRINEATQGKKDKGPAEGGESQAGTN